MAGKRNFKEKKESKNSGFRRKPDPDELSAEDRFLIIQEGVNAWLEIQDSRDWNGLADNAARLFFTGYSEEDICKVLGVTEEELRANVDLELCKAVIDAELTGKALERALAGDTTMHKFILERRLNWNPKKKVEHQGTIAHVPVLNIGFLSKEDEAKIAKDSKS